MGKKEIREPGLKKDLAINEKKERTHNKLERK